MPSLNIRQCAVPGQERGRHKSASGCGAWTELVQQHQQQHEQQTLIETQGRINGWGNVDKMFLAGTKNEFRNNQENVEEKVKLKRNGT